MPKPLIAFRIEPDHATAVRELARERGTSSSHLFRDALSQYLADAERHALRDRETNGRPPN